MNLEIQNRKGKLKLNSSVHKESADKLIEELETIYGSSAVAAGLKIGDIVCAADDALESVHVEINSPGGSVFEGSRIYEALRAMSARGVQVITEVSGIAASMGSVIFAAGDIRRMGKMAQLMIHEASTYAQGDARSLRKTADLLDGIGATLAGIYAERTGGDVEDIRNMMFEETWMDATTAIANGFATEISSLDKSNDLTNSNRMSIFASIFKSASSEELEAAQAKFDALQSDYDAAAEQVTALQSELATANESVATHVSAIAERDEKIVEIEGRVSELETTVASKDEEITNLALEVEAAKASAGEQAITMLASVGQPEPIVEPEVSNTATVDSFWEKYNTLKIEDPKAATEFFRAHADKLGLKAQ
jgi:ATP-dependent protease ClpP protease subunit/outer membrane murein-binding lipoprotein Lpp